MEELTTWLDRLCLGHELPQSENWSRRKAGTSAPWDRRLTAPEMSWCWWDHWWPMKTTARDNCAVSAPQPPTPSVCRAPASCLSGWGRGPLDRHPPASVASIWGNKQTFLSTNLAFLWAFWDAQAAGWTTPHTELLVTIWCLINFSRLVFGCGASSLLHVGFLSVGFSLVAVHWASHCRWTLLCDILNFFSLLPCGMKSSQSSNQNVCSLHCKVDS